jgi:adhesin transport system membrane fusion protein
MLRDEFVFAHDARAAREHDVPALISILILVFALMIAAFALWAHNAVLDEVTSGQGKVVPAQQVQIVQSFEGGIISELLVEEGEIVDKNQLLIRLNDATSLADLGELTERRLVSLAKIARLSAEVRGLDDIDFPQEVMQKSPELIETEIALFQSRREAVEKETEVLEPQLEQRRDELEELAAKANKTQNSLALYEKELELIEKLRQRGGVPELEVIQLQRSVSEARDEIEVIAASRKRIQSGIREYEKRLERTEIDFRAESRTQLTETIGELNVINEAISGARERVTRTEIHAPVRGTVNNISTQTIGGVIGPGQPVLEIVPLDDRLVVEARISPKDVAFIRPGQSASVKLSAYDYTVYGAIAGTVKQISATTIVSEDSEEPYYRVTIELQEDQERLDERSIEILPGMLSTVDIQTGNKTVLEYLMKPIKKLKGEALQER